MSNNKKINNKKKKDEDIVTKKKTSVSDDIVKAVTKNAPKSYDPEQSDFGDTLPANRIYTENEYDDDNIIQDQNKQGIRIRGDLPSTFTTGKYSGKKASRNDTFQQDASDDEIVEQDDDDEDVDNVFDFEDRSIGSIGSNSLVQADDLFKQLQQDNSNDEDDSKEPTLLNRVDEDEELEKAEHTKNQTQLYDDLLMTRIHLQKSINLANRFPKPADHKLLLELDPKLKQPVQEAFNEAKSLFSSLFDLQTELINRNPKIEKNKNKRTRDDISSSMNELWQSIEEQNERLFRFTNTTIEQWNNRVNITSDTVKKNLKSINQPIMAQITNTLNDYERLQRRTQLKRSNYKIIGDESYQQQENNNKSSTITNKEDLYDSEIFDDTDFYQNLLKQIENSSEAIDYIKEAKANQKAKQKTRQNNNKINKNKAVKYDVFPKLENFMPPVKSVLPDWNLDQLYNNLFGGVNNKL